MPTDQRSHPSFSPRQKWSIALNVFLMSVLVFAVVIMANYLSRDFFLRFHLSTRTKVELSPRTTHFLKTLTNRVNVVIYYDKKDPFYSTVADLLSEYSLANPKIKVETVDYLRDPGAAQKVKNSYARSSGGDKNLVLFDSEGKTNAVDGNALAQYTLEQIPNEKERQFRRKPIAFLGELAFTAALLDVTNPKPLSAYFLEGHREHEITSGDETSGYAKLAGFLQQNNIRVQGLSLAGTNPIPADCNLLVVAGPRTAIPDSELEKIDQYLTQGGRLFALFNAGSLDRATGLEKILAKWGVAIGNNVIIDKEHSRDDYEMVVSAFSKHALVNPLLGSGLYLIQPRTISKLTGAQAAGAPRVEEIAFTGQRSYLRENPARKQLYPLMAAVEKGAIKGVVTERGTTRMVIVGDSLFLANHQLDLLGNRDFAGYAVNWLLDRTQLLEGVGPRPVTEYRLVMTKTQLQSAQLLLLGGMPGAVLLIGGLVWLRRRR